MYIGIVSIEYVYLELGKVMGMMKFQVFWMVEFLFVFFVIMVGLCMVFVIVIGIIVIGIFVGVGGFGDMIVCGLNVINGIVIIFVGVILIVVMVIGVDLIMVWIERFLNLVK